jgi:copper(I)-binding protein
MPGLAAAARGGHRAAGGSPQYKKRNLEIVHPWTPETVQKDAATARVFMTIKNGGRVPDRLISASTPRAGNVALATVENAAGDGPSAAPFIIAPGAALVLHAKGPHLVLTGVKKAFHAYDDFQLALIFEKAGRIVVDVVVEEAEPEHRH